MSIFIEVAQFHDKPSNDSQSSDARFMHKLSKHARIMMRKFGNLHIWKTIPSGKSEVVVAPCKRTFFRDIT